MYSFFKDKIEIFGTYGKIQNVDVPGGSGLSFSFRHCCFVEFEETTMAEKAVKVRTSRVLELLSQFTLSTWTVARSMARRLWSLCANHLAPVPPVPVVLVTSSIMMNENGSFNSKT